MDGDEEMERHAQDHREQHAGADEEQQEQEQEQEQKDEGHGKMMLRNLPLEYCFWKDAYDEQVKQ